MYQDGAGGAQGLRLPAEGRVRQLRHDGHWLPRPGRADGALPEAAAGRSPAAAAGHPAGSAHLRQGTSTRSSYSVEVAVLRVFVCD